MLRFAPTVRSRAIPRRFTAALAGSLLVYCVAFVSGQAATFSGRVVAIVDGDTIGAMRDGREVRIRLEGIDAPENGQDFSQRAKQFTSAAVFDKTVWVAVAALSAQGPAREAVPRTAWGDPDLTGTWTTTAMSGVPLERPAQFGTRTTLSDDELLALASRLKRQAEIDAADFDHALVTGETLAGQEFRDRLEGRLATVNPIGPDPVWVERGSPSRQTSLLVDPSDGRFPPLTSDAQRRAKELAARRAAPKTQSDRNLYPRCVSRGLVGSALPMITDSGNDITQAPGYVVIRHEMIHEARVIPLDGRAHVGPAIRSYMGDSRGRWEGNTLVIDTRNFRPDIGVTRRIRCSSSPVTRATGQCAISLAPNCWDNANGD